MENREEYLLKFFTRDVCGCEQIMELELAPTINPIACHNFNTK